MKRLSTAEAILPSEYIVLYCKQSNHADHFSVIVATGLIALVDDSIKSHWHSKQHVHMPIPALMKSPLKMNMDYVGPKRLIDEVFNRRGKTVTRRSNHSRQIAAAG